MLPTTIDGVIAALQDIIDDSIKTKSRLGYFAALYKRMTIRNCNTARKLLALMES